MTAFFKKLLAALKAIFSASPVNSGGGSTPPLPPDNPPDAGGAEIIIDEPTTDVMSWKITAELRGCRWVGDGALCNEVVGTGNWPVRQDGGLKPTIGNWWLVAKIDGKLHAATMEWLGRGKLGFGGKKWDGTDATHGPLTNWVPVKGKRVGIMISGCARAGAETVKERSEIVWLVIP